MTTPDFFRSRIDAMNNLNDPLAVLASLADRPRIAADHQGVDAITSRV